MDNQFIRIRGERVRLDTDTTKTVTNHGPDTLYFGGEAVSASANDGSVAAGASYTLAGTKWFVSAGSSRVFISDSADPSGGTITPAAVLAAGGVTTEETFFPWFEDTSALADASRRRFLCPFDLEVTGVSITSLAAVSANATNYWTLDVRKIIAADVAHTPLLIASKTTQLEPTGEAFLAFTPWTFETVVFDPVNAFCVQGDQVDILWTKTLSPTAPSRLAGYITYRAV